MDTQQLKKVNEVVWDLADKYDELRAEIEKLDLDENRMEKILSHFDYPEAAVPLDMWYSALNELWHGELSDTALRMAVLDKGLEAVEEMDEGEFNSEYR